MEIKLNAKSHVDDSRREAMRTGGGQNAVGEVEEEQLVILAADKELTNSATERVTQMLGGTPAFAGITGAVDLFKPTSSCPPEDAVEQNSLVLESPEQEVVLVILLTAVRSGNIRGVTKILPFEQFQRKICYLFSRKCYGNKWQCFLLSWH